MYRGALGTSGAERRLRDVELERDRPRATVVAADVRSPVSQGCGRALRLQPAGDIRVRMLTSEIISDWSRFTTTKDEWNDLLGRSRADTIFLTWEWMRSWVEVVGESVRPFIIVIRDPHGSLAGIAPFYYAELRLAGILPYRTLRIMGDEPTGAEYPDWIARADREAEVTEAIVTALAAVPEQWDCIWMPRVAGWTAAVERILTPCRRVRLYCHIRPRDFAFFQLPQDPQAYNRALSTNKRQQLRKEMNRIIGRSGIAITRCTTVNELSRFLDALFELHHRRWETQGEEGTFQRKPNQVQFYREFAPAALEKGWLWLFALEEHGQIKAIQIGYVYRNVFHQLQEGFDPQYLKGAGNVLRAKIIEACIANGISAYDFLGGMTEHKRRWLATNRTGYDLFIGRRMTKNHLLFWRNIWPTGRYLRSDVGKLSGRSRDSHPSRAPRAQKCLG